MIPRKDIFSLSSNIKYNELITKLNNSPHSRIPIWEKNPENIIGIFHIRKLIEIKVDEPKTFNIKSYVKNLGLFLNLLDWTINF